jgi:hypothetical protein
MIYRPLYKQQIGFQAHKIAINQDIIFNIFLIKKSDSHRYGWLIKVDNQD